MSLGLKDKKKGIGLIFAIKGIFRVFITERNFRIHSLATIIVLMSGWFFGLSRLEWILLIVCIGIVLVAEMINSAIELLIDHLFPNYHSTAGHIKDIMAGSVLVAAICSSIIGFIIFLPKIMDLF